MLKKTISWAERAFRKSALWAYAFNQSRAKVVMDPIYYAVASMLLRGDIPLSARLRETKFPENLFFKYRRQSRRLQYYIEDWDFSQARPELLTPRQRQMMHTVALGETSGAAVSDGFLRAFRTDPELAAFFGLWFTEELNHFLGYHLYLERMGERWPAQRGLDVAKVEFIPYADNVLEICACNMYQELLGFLIYRSFSRQCRDPFLAKMLHQFSKDELRHYKFYQAVVARQIQREPKFRKVVLKVFLKATSPYNQISGGAQNVLDHLQMGAFYFRKPEYEYFLDQVEYLLGTDLKPFFDWYFKGLGEPCGGCGQWYYQCACPSFEDETAPAISDPLWWQKTSKPDPNARPIAVEAWIEELRAQFQGAARAAV